MAVYGTRTGAVTLTAAATKSLWLLNPAGDFCLVAQMGMSLRAAAVSDTVAFELYRTTTVGSPAGTTAVFTKVSRVADAAAPTTTGLVNLSTEPTAVEVLADWELQPLGGLLDLQYPLMREAMASAAGQRVGLRYTTPAGVTPGCRAYVWFDER